MTIRQAVVWGTQYLTDHQVADALSSARLLLMEVAGLDATSLITRGDDVLTIEQQTKYENFITLRSQHQPVAYILGHQPFGNLDLIVTPDTLIPRTETEQLVQLVLAYIDQHVESIATVIDVATGSGAIILALASAKPQLHYIATDISPAALTVAKQNATRLGLNVEFKETDLLAGITSADVVVANLPYVPSARLARLATDVRDYEPHLALDGGPDGLDLYRKLFEQLAAWPKLPQAIFCEIDETHTASFPDLVQSVWPTAQVTISQDLAGLTRYAQIIL